MRDEHQHLRLRAPSRLRLVDDVSRSLEDGILTGLMSPGTRLVEDAISKQLGVSRTTVREALLMLERRGLVTSKPRGGTFVTRISREDALDLGYTRALLESYAVTVGYKRITEQVLADMEADIARMGACNLPRELPQLVRIDLAFHRRLVECAQMPRLLELWSSLDGQLGALYIRALEEYQIGGDYIIDFHYELLDAIRSRDADVARWGVLEHYVRFSNDSNLDRATANIQTIETLVRGL